MTRKNYIEFAAMFAKTKREYHSEEGIQQAINELQVNLANYLKRNNSAFDRARFEAACNKAFE